VSEFTKEEALTASLGNQLLLCTEWHCRNWSRQSGSVCMTHLVFKTTSNMSIAVTVNKCPPSGIEKNPNIFFHQNVI